MHDAKVNNITENDFNGGSIIYFNVDVTRRVVAMHMVDSPLVVFEIVSVEDYVKHVDLRDWVIIHLVVLLVVNSLEGRYFEPELISLGDYHVRGFNSVRNKIGQVFLATLLAKNYVVIRDAEDVVQVVFVG